MSRKLAKKGTVKKHEADSLKLDVEESFSPANAKDKDFDLNLKDGLYQAKKGQAGTRTKSVTG